MQSNLCTLQLPVSIVVWNTVRKTVPREPPIGIWSKSLSTSLRGSTAPHPRSYCSWALIILCLSILFYTPPPPPVRMFGGILESPCPSVLLSVFPEDMFRTAQPFVTKLGMAMHNSELECHVRKWCTIVTIVQDIISFVNLCLYHYEVG